MTHTWRRMPVSHPIWRHIYRTLTGHLVLKAYTWRKTSVNHLVRRHIDVILPNSNQWLTSGDAFLTSTACKSLCLMSYVPNLNQSPTLNNVYVTENTFESSVWHHITKQKAITDVKWHIVDKRYLSVTLPQSILLKSH